MGHGHPATKNGSEMKNGICAIVLALACCSLNAQNPSGTLTIQYTPAEQEQQSRAFQPDEAHLKITFESHEKPLTLYDGNEHGISNYQHWNALSGWLRGVGPSGGPALKPVVGEVVGTCKPHTQCVKTISLPYYLGKYDKNNNVQEMVIYVPKSFSPLAKDSCGQDKICSIWNGVGTLRVKYTP